MGSPREIVQPVATSMRQHPEGMFGARTDPFGREASLSDEATCLVQKCQRICLNRPVDKRDYGADFARKISPRPAAFGHSKAVARRELGDDVGLPERTRRVAGVHSSICLRSDKVEHSRSDL